MDRPSKCRVGVRWQRKLVCKSRRHDLRGAHPFPNKEVRDTVGFFTLTEAITILTESIIYYGIMSIANYN